MGDIRYVEPYAVAPGRKANRIRLKGSHNGHILHSKTTSRTTSLRLCWSLGISLSAELGKNMKAPLLFGLILILGAQHNASANCDSRFDKLPCGASEGYSCKTKYAELAQCKRREADEIQRSQAAKRRKQIQAEAQERRAISLINKGNKKVHQTHGGPKGNRNKSADPSPTPTSNQGTSF